MACFVATLGVIILSGFINLSAANKDTCDFYAAIGQQTLTLSLDYKSLDKTDVLRWTHNDSIIFYGQTGRVSVGKPADISPAGSLLLKNLKASSAGIYKATVLNKNGTFVKGLTGRLCVMETILKPEVKFVCDSKASIVTLTCHVAKPQGLVFTWTLDEKTLSSETKQTLSISLAQLKGETNFTCSAANAVSKEKSNAIRLTCKGSEPALLCFKRKVVMAALAGGACLILLLLIIIVILCCRRRQNKTLLSLEDKGQVRMIPMKQQHQPDPISPEYETMHPTEAFLTPSPKLPSRAYDQAVSQAGAQAQEKPPQGSRAAEGEQPSPVPKPRMKTHQAPVN
ncbi:T-lymphocyte surface antigen Ly-9-like [Centroberyx affinis]|uniref:T-lymphocyte surface antigen Ly-9-like n=1 Tax=Centroberyx affinis TaxID=166261 RepID=UPI003A5BE119